MTNTPDNGKQPTVQDPGPAKLRHDFWADLRKNNHYSGSFEDFEATFADRDTRSAFHRDLVKNNHYSGSFEDFEFTFFDDLVKKKEAPGVGSGPGGDVPAPLADTDTKRTVKAGNKLLEIFGGNPYARQEATHASSVARSTAEHRSYLTAREQAAPGEPVEALLSDDNLKYYLPQSQAAEARLQRAQRVLGIDPKLIATAPEEAAIAYNLQSGRPTEATIMQGRRASGTAREYTEGRWASSVYGRMFSDITQGVEAIATRQGPEAMQAFLETRKEYVEQLERMSALLAGAEGIQQRNPAYEQLSARMEEMSAQLAAQRQEYDELAAGAGRVKSLLETAATPQEKELIAGRYNELVPQLTGMAEGYNALLDDARGLQQQLAATAAMTPEFQPIYEQYQEALPALEQAQGAYESLKAAHPDFATYEQLMEQATAVDAGLQVARKAYPAFFDEQAEKLVKQAKYDTLRRSSLLDVFRGWRRDEYTGGDLLRKIESSASYVLPGVILPEPIANGVRREAAKFLSGVLTLPAHTYSSLVDLPGMAYIEARTGAGEFSDLYIEGINRFLDADKSYYTMLSSQENQPLFSRQARIDGYRLTLDDNDQVTELRDSEGFKIWDAELQRSLADRYKEDPAKYTTSNVFHSAAAFQTAVAGATQIALTGLAGRAFGTGKLAQQIAGVTAQTARHSNEMYGEIISRLGEEYKPMAHRLALGSALGMSLINYAIQPLELQAGAWIKAAKPRQLLQRSVESLQRDLAAGWSRSAASKRALNLFWQDAFASAKASARALGTEGMEGVLENMYDAGARMLVNSLTDPDAQLDIASAWELARDGFLEETLGALFGGGLRWRSVNRSQGESLLLAQRHGDRDALLAGLPAAAQSHFRGLLAEADATFAAEQWDDERQMAYLITRHGRGMLAQAMATGQLDEAQGAAALAELDGIEGELRQGEAVPAAVNTLADLNTPGEQPPPATLEELEARREAMLGVQPGQQVTLPGDVVLELREVKQSDTDNPLLVFDDRSTGRTRSFRRHGPGSYEQLINELVDEQVQTQFGAVSEERAALSKDLRSRAAAPVRPAVPAAPLNPAASAERSKRYTVDTVEQLPKDFKGFAAPVRRSLQRASRVLRALQGLGDFSLVVHRNDADFRAAATELYGAAAVPENLIASGMYVSHKGEIHLNAAHVQSNTAYHEAIHPIIDQVFAASPAVAERFYNQLIDRGLLQLADLQEFVARSAAPDLQRAQTLEAEGKGEEAERARQNALNTMRTEAIVEFMARVADNRIDLAGAGILGKLRLVLQDLTRLLGVEPGEITLDSAQDVQQFAYKVAQAMRQGRTLRLQTQAITAEERAAVAATPKFQFIGQRGAAAFAKVSAELDEARRLEESGRNPERIRLLTGWHRGADNLWRYEINSSDAQWNTDKLQGRRSIRLGEILQWDTLFDHYPTLADLKITVSQKPGTVLAGYDPRGHFIRVYPKAIASEGPEALTDVLHHELQHVIQGIEGFDPGANRGIFRRSMAQREALREDLALSRAALEYQHLQSQGLDEAAIPAALATAMPDVDERTREQAMFYAEFLDEAELRDNIERISLELEFAEAPLQGYIRNAGEVEARNVEARRPLSAAQRRLIAPAATQDADPVPLSRLLDMSVDPERAPISTPALQIIGTLGANRLQGVMARLHIAEAMEEPEPVSPDEVTIYHRPDDFTQQAGYIALKSDGGGVRGFLRTKDQLPEKLFHVTVAYSDIYVDGRLKGYKGFEGRGLGGGQLRGVSFTTDADKAAHIETELHFAVEAANVEDYDQAAELFDIMAETHTEIYGEDAAEGFSQARNAALQDIAFRKEHGRDLLDGVDQALRLYRMVASRRVKAYEDPIIMGGLEKFRGVQPFNIHTFEVSRDNIPDGAAIARGTDVFLDEIRVFSEVPLTLEAKSPHAIRLATGWERGIDGHWRYEIDDTRAAIPTETAALAAKLYGKPTENMALGTLEEWFDHPELLQAYPQLKSIKVHSRSMENTTAAWSQLRQTIYLNFEKISSETSLRSSMLHELQHAIQEFEGFAEGASPDYFDKPSSTDVYHYKAMETLNWVYETARKYGQTAAQVWENVENVYRLGGGPENEFIYQSVDGFIRNGDYESPGNRAVATELAKFRALDPVSNYMRAAGEVEARNVEARLDYDELQRKAIPLHQSEDVRRSDQVILQAGQLLLPNWQIHAYHGTTVNFDRFSTDFVNTGEKAQAYGWGLYFTESKRVATEQYAERLYAQKAVLPRPSRRRLSQAFNIDRAAIDSVMTWLYDRIPQSKISGNLYGFNDNLKALLASSQSLDPITVDDLTPTPTLGINGPGLTAEQKSAYQKATGREIGGIARYGSTAYPDGTFLFYDNDNIKNVRVEGEAEAQQLLVDDYNRQVAAYNATLASARKLQQEVAAAIDTHDANHVRALYKVVLHQGKKPNEYDHIDYHRPITTAQLGRIARRWAAENDNAWHQAFRTLAGSNPMRSIWTLDDGFAAAKINHLRQKAPKVYQALRATLAAWSRNKQPFNAYSNKAALEAVTWALEDLNAGATTKDAARSMLKSFSHTLEVPAAELPAVTALIETMRSSLPALNSVLVDPGNPTGELIIETLNDRLGARQASEFLLRAGIDGVRYPVNYRAGGRGNKGYNYVVFDEAAVTIEARANWQLTGTLHDTQPHWSDPDRVGARSVLKNYLPLAKRNDERVAAGEIQDTPGQLTTRQLTNAVAAHFGLPLPDVQAMIQAEQRIPLRVGVISAPNPTNNVFKGIKNFFARNFVFNQGLDPVIQELQEAMSGAVENSVHIATDLVRRVEKIMQRKDVAAKVSTQMIDEYLRGEAPQVVIDIIEAASPELASLLDNMRHQVDNLSSVLIADGYFEDRLVWGPDLKARIEENLGKYLTRAYRIFHDPGYRPDQQVVAAAEAYFVRTNKDAFLKAHANLPPQAAMERLQNLARQVVGTILAKPETAFTAEPALGAMNTGILKHRKELPPIVRQTLGKGTMTTQAQRDELLELATKQRLRLVPPRFSTAGAQAEAARLAAEDVDNILAGKIDRVPWAVELAPEIRQLLGEYTNPLEAYFATIWKLTHFVESGRFLLNLQNAGLGRLFWTRDDPRLPADAVYPLVKAGSESRAPLARIQDHARLSTGSADLDELFLRKDLYTTKEVYEAIHGAMENSRRLGDILWTTLRHFIGADPANKFWSKANAIVNFSTTVLSAVTQVRNVIGNLPFMVSRGDFDVLLGLGLLGANQKGRDAYRAIASDANFLIAQALGGRSYGEIAALPRSERERRVALLLEKMKRFGIMDQAITYAAVEEILQADSGLATYLRDLFEPARAEKIIKNVLGKTAGKVAAKGKEILWDGTINTAKALYRSGDNFFKIYAFLTEQANYAKILYDKEYGELTLTEQLEVDRYASEIVKNTLPNYARLGQVQQAFARSYFFSNFIAFHVESLRVNINQMALIHRELRSGNATARTLGAKRLTGYLAANILRGVLVSMLGQFAGGVIGKALRAFDDDWEPEQDELTEKAVRQFIHKWLNYNDIIVTSTADGYIELYDFSSADPYNNVQRILNAWRLQDDYGESLHQASKEVFRPFIQEPTILAQAVGEALTGRNTYDEPIYSEFAGDGERLAKGLLHVARVFEPGTIRSVERYMEGRMDKDQLPGYFTGVTPYKIDIERSFQWQFDELYDSRERLTKRREIEKDYYRVMNDDGLSPGERAARIAAIEEKRKVLLEEARQLYVYAQHLGIDSKNLITHMVQRTRYPVKDGKLDLAYILHGKYIPMVPERFIIRRDGD